MFAPAGPPDALLAVVARLKKAGGPFHDALREAHRAQLRHLAELGVERVTVHTRCCPECDRRLPSEISIEEALTTTLPHPACTRHREYYAEGDCCCRYRPA